MGVVYRARDRALDRQVALKLLLDTFGPDSGAARRFLDEARITGQLQHPGIPAVYQVGALADGRPFLAMKLIKGQTLAELLKAGTAVDTLAVFGAISQAVGYAHAHGVIHRDLKPANVMVGTFGEVQVMDWGLAKILADRQQHERPKSDAEATTAPSVIRRERDSDTPFTQYGSMLGTPAYMAPEQAAGELDKIGPQADVFGLGAILCTLLTGKPPYEGKDAESVRIAAVRGELSAALARLDGCTADPEVIALCKRCLAFDVGARPATAEVVATEVAEIRQDTEDRARRAELDRERTAVQAAEEGKRRRVLTGAATALAVVLTAGAGVSAWQAMRARTAETAAIAEAENARNREEQEKKAREDETKARETAEAVSIFMREVFAQASAHGQVSLTRTAKRDLTVKEAMDFAAMSVAGRFPARPDIEAAVRTAIGLTYMELASFPQAKEQLQLALAIQEKAGGPDHPDTLLCVNNLGRLLHVTGDLQAAESMYRRALAGQEKVPGPDHPDTLSTVNNLAALLYDKTDLRAAEPFYRRALAGREKVLGPDHRKTLESANNMAIYLRTTGDLTAAEPLHRRVLAGSEKALSPEHPDTLTAAGNLAELLRMKGDYAAAEPLYRRALAGQEKVLSPDHPVTLGTVNNLAVMLFLKGDLAGAEPLLQRALAGKEKALGPDHGEVLMGVNNLAVVNFTLRRYTTAAPLFERALAGYQKRPEGAFAALVTEVYLGLTQLGAGDAAVAEPHLLAGYEGLVKQKLSPQNRKWPRMAAQGLIDLYEKTKQPEKADEWRAKLSALPPEITSQPGPGGK